MTRKVDNTVFVCFSSVLRGENKKEARFARASQVRENGRCTLLPSLSVFTSNGMGLALHGWQNNPFGAADPPMIYTPPASSYIHCMYHTFVFHSSVLDSLPRGSFLGKIGEATFITRHISAHNFYAVLYFLRFFFPFHFLQKMRTYNFKFCCLKAITFVLNFFLLV